MKPYLEYAVVMILILMISSCRNSDKKTATTSKAQHESSKQQEYSLDTSGILISWTAYKFSNKVAVSGTFNTYAFETKNTSGSIETILNKSKLTIPTAGVNSSNPIRDFKLEAYFFKAFNTAKIEGTVTRAKANEGIIDLTMNRTSKRIPFTYNTANDTIRLFTNLNLNYWKVEEALKTLNTECYELHKGTDGISKLWPDVDVLIKLPIHKTLILK